MTNSDESFDIEFTAPDLAEIEERQATGYWDAIESGRYEVRYNTHLQQQEPNATAPFDSQTDAEAHAEELKARGLFRVVVAPIHVYRGTGEVVGG